MPFDAVSFISVVVCTYNRKNLLKSCLISIHAQDYPQSGYEIIVVDGGSTDGTMELSKEFPKVKFITERKFGLAHARNKGAELAQGSIVAYTDDDCIVDKEWLQNLLFCFKNSKKIMGVGGPVTPLHPEIIPDKIKVKAALGLFDDGDKPKLTSGVITSNSAFKKELFNSIKFDETLRITRRNNLLLSGEDVEFCHKIIASGYHIAYNPEAKVYHQVRVDRIRVPYLLKHAIHSAISKSRILRNKKNSRLWATRYALSQLVQCVLKIPYDTSFTSCYNLTLYASAFFICLTGLDRVV